MFSRFSFGFIAAATFSLLVPVSTLEARPDNNASGNAPFALLKEFRPIGGGGNNLQHPSFDPFPGAPELSLTPLNFAPGISGGMVDGPNARTISTFITGGTGAKGQNGDTEDSVASAWLYVFGQFIDHDLDLESTPVTNPEIDIVVPQGDPVFTAGTAIPMNRDVRSPVTNTIINTTAGYLDLSQLYGPDEATAASLRNADGTLVSTGNGEYLPVQDGYYVAGDPRVMENPELTAVTTLFMREHNYWISRLKSVHPNWTGDQLYNMAKAINTAEYQNIVYSEYVPLLIGNVLGPYGGYNPHISAQVTQEFSTSAFRMGHSQVSDTQEGIDNAGNVTYSESLAQAFFNSPADDEGNGVDALIRGISADFSQATDVYSVAALRNLLFAPLVGGDVDEMDLIAIDIQRERDVGIGTLNQTRQALGLRPYESFAQLTSDPDLRANLKTVYGSIDKVDLFIGGLAEPHVRGADVGETFEIILAKQFYALRAGDRFYWQNENFDAQTMRMIASTTLGDIIKRNTDTTHQQSNVFLAAASQQHRKQHTIKPVDRHDRWAVFEWTYLKRHIRR